MELAALPGVRIIFLLWPCGLVLVRVIGQDGIFGRWRQRIVLVAQLDGDSKLDLMCGELGGLY
jgi:hypothetical protein